MAEESDVVVPFVQPGGTSPSGTSPSSPVEDPFFLDDPTPLAAAPVASASARSFAKRWKHDALFADGYVGVPVAFLQLYAQLNLTPGEAMFVLHMMQFKWDDKSPFPSYRTIANQMGVSDKMTRRHAQSLETKKYLRRVQRTGSTNRFDLTPLFDALAELQRHNATTKAVS